MTAEEARRVLGPAVVAEIAAAPTTPMTPELADRLAALLMDPAETAPRAAPDAA